MGSKSLAYALYVECPRCGQQIDVGQSSEQVGPAEAKALADKPGVKGLQGTCPGCQSDVVISIADVRSRIRN